MVKSIRDLEPVIYHATQKKRLSAKGSIVIIREKPQMQIRDNYMELSDGKKH